MFRFLNYDNNILRSFLYNKFLYKSSFLLPYLDVVYVSIFIDDLLNKNELIILESIYILEILTLQKSFIKKLKFGFKNGKKKLSLYLKITLRNYKMFNFLNIFNICLVNYNKKKKEILNLNKYVKMNNLFLFKVKEFSFFFFLREFFIEYDKCINIVLVLKNIEKKDNNQIIHNFLKFLNN